MILKNPSLSGPQFLIVDPDAMIFSGQERRGHRAQNRGRGWFQLKRTINFLTEKCIYRLQADKDEITIREGGSQFHEANGLTSTIMNQGAITEAVLMSASVERLERPLATDREDCDDQWVEQTEEKAQRGDEDALFSLGQYHFSRDCHVTALEYFARAESAGCAQASYQLGVMYYDGVGTSQDPRKGFQHMLKAATTAGNSVGTGAQYNIGRAYFQGYGVVRSDEEAEKWWLKAGGEETKRGEQSEDEEHIESVVRAQNTLGMFYSREETSDFRKSLYWHSCAAENGHLESMAAEGLMRLNGRGCPQDETAGLQLLRKATAGGSLYAAGLLALYYFTSKLFFKATEMALRVCESHGDAENLSLLEKRGVAMACFIFARCLQLGQAVTQDREKAIQHFIKAKNYDKSTVIELYSKVIQGML